MNDQSFEPQSIKTQDLNKEIEIIIKKRITHNQILQLDSKIEFEVFDKALDSYKGQVQEIEIMKKTNQRLNLEDIYEIMVDTIESHQFNLPNSNLQIINNEDRSFVFFQYNLKICNKIYPIKLSIPLEKVQIPISQYLYRSNQKWFNEIEKLKQLKFSDDEEQLEICPRNRIIHQLSNEVNQNFEKCKLDIQELKQQSQIIKKSVDQCVNLKADIDKIQNSLQWFEDNKQYISLIQNLNDQNLVESQSQNRDNFLKIESENTTLKQQIDKLNSLNIEISETNNNQIQLLKTQNQELLEEVNSLQKANSQMSESIKELNEHIQQLKDSNNGLKNELDKLKNGNLEIIKSKDQEIQQLNQKNLDLQAQITKLNTQKCLKNTKIKSRNLIIEYTDSKFTITNKQIKLRYQIK